MLPTMIALDGRTLTLDALAAIAGGASVGLAPDARVGSTPRAPSSTRRGRRRAGLRRQHRLRLARRDANRHGRSRRAAGEPGAQPRRRRRRSAAGAHGARGDGAARQRAGQGLLRHPARDARGAARAAQRRRAPVRAEPRIGRRQRRPGAARAPGAGAGRRGRASGTALARPRRADALAAAGLEPVALGRQGGAGADQRHAGVDGGRWRWRSPAPSGWRAPPTSSPR